ncbi:MAG TPA: FHA domain-containing protein [Luteolibacter sp.]|nr:FHA domain-containing protein [Luteolibacter sp.]
MPRVIITVPGSTPQPYLFQLDRKSVTLGRGSINDIVVDCGSVSVKHAEMRRVEGGYELRDLGSTNGLKIHGETRETVPLHDGETVWMGDVSFEFTLNAEELEALGHERPLEESPIIREPVETLAEEPAESGETEEYIADESEADEEPEPKRKAPRRKPKPMVTGLPQGSPFGCVWLFWTLLIAVIAFCAGMMLRYEREHSDPWWKAVRERFVPTPQKSPPPAEP